MRATRKDVSIRSGVSVSTVGMILNGRGDRYNPETCQKVIRAAEELNYRPHISARGLRMNRSLLIGVSIFEGNSVMMTELTRGVQQALGETEYSALVFSHCSPEEELEWHRRCTERQVDGMIINPGRALDGSAETKMSYLDSIGRNVPVVEILGHAVIEAPSVNIDDRATGMAAVNHLRSLGHTRIAMLTHDRYRSASATGMGRHADAWHRYQGFYDLMVRAGLEPLVITHPIPGEINVKSDFFEGGLASLDAILKQPSRPTAVICYNDYEAYGLIRAAEQAGISVPGQLSVIGYGDLEFSNFVEPGITTFSSPALKVGKHAARSLLALIEKQSFEDVLLEPNLIIRGSSCALS